MAESNVVRQQVIPSSARDVADILRSASERNEHIVVHGANSKAAMPVPAGEAQVHFATTGLDQVIQYEPRDLTISVGAGMRFADLSRLLASNGQMIPLDPPFFETATVGGVIAANSSGSRRRLYGAARDMVIGMTFATLEGQLIQTGGMVVKNVAGLDMGKLMIGSFGTLAVITSVNFKLIPRPEATRTFVIGRGTGAAVFAERDKLLKGVLQPAAVDVLNPAASALLGMSGWVLLVRAGGTPAVLNRYAKDLSQAIVIEGDKESVIWEKVREFTPTWMMREPGGRIARISSTLTEVRAVMELLPGPAIARAGSGVTYGYFEDDASWKPASNWNTCFEWGGETAWGDDYPVMEKVKNMMDPRRLLNRGRFYGRF